MRPVDQDIFGSEKGNCFAACVASVFELPLSDVPNFCGDNPGDGGEWFRAFVDWLKPRGWTAVYEFEETCDVRKEHGIWYMLDEVVCIAGGPGPRGCDHAVVMRGDEVLHDPHPSRGGLLSVFDRTFFFPLDPGSVS